ncbi:universal stress protein [Azospirillum sp. sgz301742]
MIKHILVPVDGSSLDEHALSAAFGLATLFSGHVEALHIRNDPRQSVRIIGEGFSAEMVDDLLREAEQATSRTADAARSTFNQAVALSGAEVTERPHGNGQITAHLREVVGWPSAALGREGRFADLVLVAQAPADPNRMPLLEAALFDAGRPLLLASAATPTDAFPTIAVAWDGSLPAVRAVANAMPLLRQALAVHIVTVEEEDSHGLGGTPIHAERMANHLGWHGINAMVQPVRRQECTVGEALVAKAEDLGAGLLVMGGYGHSRFREMILGGATRHMLGTPLGCSVFMAH